MHEPRPAQVGHTAIQKLAQLVSMIHQIVPIACDIQIALICFDAREADVLVFQSFMIPSSVIPVVAALLMPAHLATECIDFIACIGLDTGRSSNARNRCIFTATELDCLRLQGCEHT